MEETHFKFSTLLIYHRLNLIIQIILLDNDVILEYHGILETLIEASSVKIHMSKEASDSILVKISYIWSFGARIIMHLDSFIEIIWVYVFFIFSGNLNLPCISTIYDFDRNILSMTLEESFLAFLLIFDSQ